MYEIKKFNKIITNHRLRILKNLKKTQTIIQTVKKVQLIYLITKKALVKLLTVKKPKLLYLITR